MVRSLVEHLTNIRQRAFVMMVACVASLAALGGLASPAPAIPKGEFAVFAGCPLSTHGVEGCLVAKTESGKFIIGKRTVPITNVITLQGGVGEENPCSFPFTGAGECRMPFYGAAAGYETLSKTPQNVPGGLLNLIKCKEISNKYEREFCDRTRGAGELDRPERGGSVRTRSL